MADEPKPSHSLRFNFDLVMAEIARWPLVTVAFLAITAAQFVFLPPNVSQQDFIANPSAADKALLLAGALSGLLGLKALLLLMLYPLLRNAPFPGSYLLTSFMSCVPLLAFFAAGARASREGPTSAWVRILIGYVLSSVLCAGFLRVQHAILMAQRDWWHGRLAKLRAFLRRDKSSKPPG